MLQIKKMRADHVIDFAAEELKKYLRMMMPHQDEIDIFYDPNATDAWLNGLGVAQTPPAEPAAEETSDNP